MKQITKKAVAVLISLVLALIVCETGLRVVGIGYPDFYDFDPVCGSRLRPGISGPFLREGGGWVSINSDGLRDREHSLPHPPNTLRIAVLGDSFAEAMAVNQDEAFWSIMEKDLQKCPDLDGRRAEVINFGEAGFGTAQELLALRHRALKYAPDAVLLAFFTGNDMADNSPAMMQFPYNPYFTLKNGKLVLHDELTRAKWQKEQQRRSWGGDFARWRQDHLRVFQVWRQFEMVLKAWWATTGEAQAAQTGPEAGLKEAVYRPPATPEWQEAWRVTEALILKMRDEVEARGAKFYVVVLTIGAQVLPDPKAVVEFAQTVGVPDLLYSDRRLETFCREHGIPVLLLAPVFQEYAARHNVYLHGFKGNLGVGHWNRDGHRLAGDTIARWLCGQLH